MRPTALDLFCGAGGASMGLFRAGFDVVGVDNRPQPRYPFTFHQADALTFPLDGFDFIWASPPCQAFSAIRHVAGREYPNLIPQTRAMLRSSGVNYCIENVPGAPLHATIILCGSMFDLGVRDAELRRHRLFETSFLLLQPSCRHGQRVIQVHGTGTHGDGKDRWATRRVIGVHGHSGVPNAADQHRNRRHGLKTISVTGNTAQQNVERNTVRETYSTADAGIAMGIDWMTMKGLSQAIPPAYSEFIGKAAIQHIGRAAA